jgi:hypothetical protein
LGGGGGGFGSFMVHVYGNRDVCEGSLNWSNVN